MAGFNKYVRILEQLAIYPLLVKKSQKKLNFKNLKCFSGEVGSKNKRSILGYALDIKAEKQFSEVL